MANTTISPNMNLPVPVVAVDPGPDWATNVNSCLYAIDSHNHTPGQGVLLTPNSLNINADLQMNNNNLTQARSVRFFNQTVNLSNPTDIGCLYEVNGDLFYNDGSGNQIRFTQSGSIVGTAGSITGLPSGTASASYAGGTFTFQSATATPANIDGGSFILRNNVANSKGLTLSPPNAMAADYGLTLPSLPSVQSIMSIDTSGNMAGSYVVDNVTIVISGNTIEIPGNVVLSGLKPSSSSSPIYYYLDWLDYTPVVKFGSTVATVNVQRARYTILNSQVTAFVNLIITSKNAGVGDMTMSVPVSLASVTTGFMPGGLWNSSNDAANYQCMLAADSDLTIVDIFSNRVVGGGFGTMSHLSNSEFSDGDQIWFTFTYQT